MTTLEDSSSDTASSRSSSPATPRSIETTELGDVVERWMGGNMRPSDNELLRSTVITKVDYEEIRELYHIRHGAQLLDFHLTLTELATSLHEYMGGWMTG